MLATILNRIRRDLIAVLAPKPAIAPRPTVSRSASPISTPPGPKTIVRKTSFTPRQQAAGFYPHAGVTTRQWLEQRPEILAQVERHLEMGTRPWTIGTWLIKEHGYPYRDTAIHGYLMKKVKAASHGS